MNIKHIRKINQNRVNHFLTMDIPINEAHNLLRTLELIGYTITKQHSNQFIAITLCVVVDLIAIKHTNHYTIKYHKNLL